MLYIKNRGILVADSDRYLSFPDISFGPDQKSLFLVYRSGDAHHPVESRLHLWRSDDMGHIWDELFDIPMSMEDDGAVWNCPRICFRPKGRMLLVCDTKSDIDEQRATFNIIFINISTVKNTYKEPVVSGMQGMVPDRFISFRNRTVCAAHRWDRVYSNLIQLAYWSRDNGRTFSDCNIIARQQGKSFCEASLVNIRDNVVFAYMRENTRQTRNVYLTYSSDLVNWGEPKAMKIKGHRVTAHNYKHDQVVGTFRNTEDMSVSMFRHQPSLPDDLEVLNIESEKVENIYNFGYSAFCEIKPGVFFVVYYLKQDEPQPFIAYALVEDA